MRTIGEYIQGVGHWRLIVWLIGAIFIYIGGGWPLTGPGVAGAVLVAVAVLRLPWGPGAYRWRCASAASRAARAIESATKHSYAQQRRHLRELLRVSVPDGLAEKSSELLSLIETAEETREDRTTALPERSAALVGLQARIKQMSASIATQANTVNERNYSDAIHSMVTANDRATEEQIRESLRCLTDLIACQDRLRPPKRLRAAHDSMCRAFREEYATLSKYYAASRGIDAEAVRIAATEYQHAAQECYARLEDLGVRTAAKLPRRAT